MTGLVLSAGGARGAYQAGVLKRIGELPAFRGGRSPFPIVAGASAGALNGAMIAANSGDFAVATSRLADMWRDLRVEDVYRADFLTLTGGGLRLLQDLSLGAMIGTRGSRALLDASPLREFLERNLRLDGIGESVRAGHLYAFAVSATSYYSGKSFTFIEGRQGHPLWYKSRRVSLAVKLTVDHICASAAIPVVFAPVLVRSTLGDYYFGDGGLRLVTPFSPAIRLGATRVFAIGIRSNRAAEVRSLADLLEGAESAERPTMSPPPLAQIFGVFLNAIFLDHLDTDLDHLIRMNELIRYYGEIPGHERQAPTPGPQVREPMRIVEPMVIDPSEDLAAVAERFADRMPRMVRIAMEGLGSSRAQSADLLSYLLFDGQYTRELVEIGYRDAASRIERIEAFLRGEAAGDVSPEPAPIVRPKRVVIRDA